MVSSEDGQAYNGVEQLDMRGMQRYGRQLRKCRWFHIDIQDA